MFKATTILGVKHKNKVALGGDGQVTFGDTILKAQAKKIRKLYNNTVLSGFAGASAEHSQPFRSRRGCVPPRTWLFLNARGAASHPGGHWLDGSLSGPTEFSVTCPWEFKQ